MKKFLFLFLFVLISSLATSQFEQKVSFDLSAGIFKTFGKKLTMEGGYTPMQMPNYKTGFSANTGMQFKISRRFSLSAGFGIMVTEKWFHKKEFSSDNWISWSFNDTIDGLYYAGENYLDIFNYSINIRPKYYLLPEKKLNPYVFAGVSFNLTRANYEDTEWEKKNELDYLPIDDTGPINDFLEKNNGIGFNPGIGVEYSFNNRMHFYFEPCYYLILLNKLNFAYSERTENLNAFVLQAGLKYYFVKSKEL